MRSLLTLLLNKNTCITILLINFIILNRNIFIISWLISTHPQFNVVSSGSVTVVSVKSWDTRNRTAIPFNRTTTFAIPKRISFKKTTWILIILITRFTKEVISNKFRYSLCVCNPYYRDNSTMNQS